MRFTIGDGVAENRIRSFMPVSGQRRHCRSLRACPLRAWSQPKHLSCAYPVVIGSIGDRQEKQALYNRPFVNAASAVAVSAGHFDGDRSDRRKVANSSAYSSAYWARSRLASSGSACPAM